ncbi:phosphoserine phosphatase SerB [uncultured Shewanella sp.]|uniref:phosphoserine phosphatase SerB n=1 Tax=uncultured Shewanella sp. TaxID=173975 RepID=UPI00260AB069|nr:phosphoserine phosphatase SerB [uncultured Shewanella sp.]
MKSLTEASLLPWLRDTTVSQCVINDVHFTRYEEAGFPTRAFRYRVIFQTSKDESMLLQWLVGINQAISMAVIERLSQYHCVEIALEVALTDRVLNTFPSDNTIELFSLPNKLPLLNQAGVLVMDMDSTAIQIECIDELAKMAGVGKAVSEVTERAMQGELDFEESLRARVAQLKGAKASIIATLCQRLPLMPGLVDMVEELKSHGWYVVLASGGFTAFVEHLKNELDLDAAFANKLVIENELLTGEVNGQVVDAQFKANTLDMCAKRWKIESGQRLAIGDGANDIPMIQAADFGIAFHGKPKLTQAADVAIHKMDLKALPFLLLLA